MLPGPGTPLRVSSINGKILINGIPLADFAAPAIPSGPPPPPASWTRVVRAVAVLEHMGSPAARDLIERIAQGEADALPTIEARAALERMKGKK